MITTECLLLLFKIPKDRRKDFFEIDRQFEHMPSKKFASPVLAVEHRLILNRLATPWKQNYSAPSGLAEHYL
jgi:hypothetical protein